MTNYRNKDTCSNVSMYWIILQPVLNVTDFSGRIITWTRRETNIKINFVQNVEDVMFPFWKGESETRFKYHTESVYECWIAHEPIHLSSKTYLYMLSSEMLGVKSTYISNLPDDFLLFLLIGMHNVVIVEVQRTWEKTSLYVQNKVSNYGGLGTGMRGE